MWLFNHVENLWPGIKYKILGQLFVSTITPNCLQNVHNFHEVVRSLYYVASDLHIA